MKRAPVVLGSTATGLALVLGFHTHHLSLAKAARSSTSSTSPSSQRSGSSGQSTTTPSAVTGSAATKTATGQDVQYQYGDIQLSVTASGTKITNISVVQESATDPRSAQINGLAVPMLTQQAMSVQSAQIDGVSGATFTSAAYAQSLQSALDQLGIK